jgi:hypothetical protein
MSLRSRTLGIAAAAALLAAVVSSAAAEDPAPPKAEAEAEDKAPERDQPRERAAAAAAADVKAAKAVEDREPVDVSDTFDAGETVWIWSRVEGAKDTTVRHVWKRGDTELSSVPLKIGSNRWRTFTRRTVAAGQYTVEVVSEDDQVIGQVAFTVQ